MDSWRNWFCIENSCQNHSNYPSCILGRKCVKSVIKILHHYDVSVIMFEKWHAEIVLVAISIFQELEMIIMILSRLRSVNFHHMLWCCHSLLWILHVPHIFIVYLGVPPHPSCACSGGEWTEEWSSSFCLHDSLLYVMSLTNLQLAIVWCNNHRTNFKFFFRLLSSILLEKTHPSKKFLL